MQLLFVVKLKHAHKRFLRNLHIAYLPHAFLALLLLFEKFFLT